VAILRQVLLAARKASIALALSQPRALVWLKIAGHNFQKFIFPFFS
jgi:hypothetical protein